MSRYSWWKLWILVVWPGLPSLWLRGSLPGLLLSVSFAMVTQVVLWTALIWPELWFDRWSTLVYAAYGCFWVLMILISLRTLQQNARDSSEDCTDTLLRNTHGEYLRGNWFQAEALLLDALSKNAADAEARLCLASLYRRIHRPLQARDQLRQLGSYATAERWQPEIQRELNLLAGSRANDLRDLEKTDHLPINRTKETIDLDHSGLADVA